MTAAEFSSIVERVFGHLQRLGRQSGRQGRKGIDGVEVKAQLSSIDLTASSSLLDLYAISDGTNVRDGETLGAIQFFPGYYWMRLEECVTVYRSICKDTRWRRAWLPIFASGGGDFYAVVCDAESPDFGGVVGFILGEDDHLIEFKNLFTMFQVIERAFAENAFYVVGNALKADYPRMRAIAVNVQVGFKEHLA